MRLSHHVLPEEVRVGAYLVAVVVVAASDLTLEDSLGSCS